jgi:hypothetical protein
MGLRLRAQEGADHFRRNTLATRERDVRVPRSQIRFESRAEHGVGDSFVQLEEMRMPRADSDPDDFRSAFCRKSAESGNREEERRKADGEQISAQFFLRLALDVAKKSEREMHLLQGEPAHTAQVRIEPNECESDRFGQVETNEQTLRSHDGRSRAVARFVMRPDRAIGQPRQPTGSALLFARLPAGAQLVAFRTGGSGQNLACELHHFTR